MFELWFTVLHLCWLVALALLTYVSLVDLIKLKLKGGFLFTIGSWLFFIFNLGSSLEFFPFTVSFVLGGLAIIIMLISLYVDYCEHDRASSIYQLLRKLPLKDRVLRRIPESLLKEPLPPPIPPPISFKLAVALTLILPAAIGSIIYGYTLSIEASWTFPIDIPGYGTVDVPLPPAIHARNWYPIFFLCGIFLFIAAILTIKKHQRIGGIIALIFSAVIIFEGRPIGILLGVIGISGGILALTERKTSNKKNFIEELSMANTSSDDNSGPNEKAG